MQRSTLGPFVLTDRVGRGGMSEVWRAVHEQDQVEVAVKVLTADKARRPKNQRQFRQEIRAVAKLDHPHIVGVHDAGEVTEAEARGAGGWLRPGMPYLVMDYLSGGSLWSYRGRLRWTELRSLLRRLLDALAHAHARGVIHRDLKLTNVMVSAERRAVLTDFGLAHLLDPDAVLLKAGTPTYMAPEQFLHQWRDFGPWTDLYGLGCLAWTLATGRPPFLSRMWEETRRAHLTDDPPTLESIQTVPDGFEAWLHALLRKDPAQRTQSAADAAWALEQLDDVDDDDPLGADPTTESSPLDTEPLDISTVSFGTTGTPEPLLTSVGRRDRPPPPPEDWRRSTTMRRLHLRGTGLGLVAHRTIPTVGRQRERDVLWEALVRQHAAPLAHAVLIEGPAGTGKSHLARWLGRRAHEVGAAHVLVADHAPGVGRSFGLAGMLTRHLVLDGLEGDALRERVARAARSWGTPGPSDQLVLAEIADGASTRATLQERSAVLSRHLTAVGARRPVVLILDDAHRGIDGLAFAHWLLEHRESHPTPVLLVIVVEDEGRARARATVELLDGLSALSGVSRLRVEPLTEEEQLQLVTEWLGLQGELARRVARRTGGHPGFALALLGDWIERGVLERAEGGYRLSDGAVVHLPNDLHHLWAAHLSLALAGHPDGAWRALEIAAAMGMRLATAEWQRAAAAAGAHPSLEAVEALVEARLAGGKQLPGAWRFAHGMVRESLLRRADDAGRLVGWHQAVLDELSGELEHERRARHLLGAGHLAEGVEALLRAAARLEQDGNPHGVLDLCEQAERVWTPVISRALTRTLALRRARALLALGRLDEADEAAQAGLGSEGDALSEQVAVDLRIVLAQVDRRRGHLSASGDALRDLAHELRRADLPRQLSDTLRALGRVLYARGDLDAALAALTEARATAARLDDPAGWAECTAFLADAMLEVGRLDDAAAVLDEALARRAELPGQAHVAMLLDGRARLAQHRGQPHEAEARLLEALDLLEHVGSLDAVLPRLHLAALHALEGRYGEAWRLGERCRREATRQGRPPMELAVRAVLLVAARGLGNDEAAAEQLDAVVGLARMGVTASVETYALLGLALRHLQDDADAASAAHRLRRVVVDWAYSRGRRHRDRIATLVGLPSLDG